MHEHVAAAARGLRRVAARGPRRAVPGTQDRGDPRHPGEHRRHRRPHPRRPAHPRPPHPAADGARTPRRWPWRTCGSPRAPRASASAGSASSTSARWSDVLGPPEHLEVVAYLCVGYVDEFPEEPELRRRAGPSAARCPGSSTRRRTAAARCPGRNRTTCSPRPSPRSARWTPALGEAWERQKRMTKPAGALGMLEDISATLAGDRRELPAADPGARRGRDVRRRPRRARPGRHAVAAGGHRADGRATSSAGGAVFNAFARQVGAEVCVVDVGVAAPLDPAARAAAAQGSPTAPPT